MLGKKNCCSSSKLCPLSFGLALGVTSFLAMLFWSAWLMLHGVPGAITGPEHMILPLTWSASFAYALIGFIKGFIFGFILVLLYDCFCCCGKRCCNKEGGANCDCGCCGCKGCACGTKSGKGG